MNVATPLVAVAIDKYARAVERLDTEGKPVDRTGAPVPHAYAVVPLGTMLATRYTSDAHFVAYLVRDEQGRTLERQPRIAKRALPALEAAGVSVWVGALFADLDRADHSPWPDAAAALEALRAVKSRNPECGGYTTRAGVRLYRPLARPMRAPHVEGYASAWLDSLAPAAGLGVDRSCLDWTRHYRAPHVVRA